MLMRTLSMLTLALAVLLTGGCVKMKQIVTVMPDGSGKLEFTFGVSEMMAEQSGEDPFEEFSMEEIAADLPEGVVAVTEPEQWEDGGYQYVRFTMYFEDINALELQEDGDSGEMFGEYTFENNGDGCTLTVNGGMMQQLTAEYEQPGADEVGMMKQMMEGIELVEHYILPGEAEDVDGMTMVDNTADITIDMDNLINGDGPIAELDGGAIELVVPENSIDQATVDAFAAELAQAIEDWEALLEEMEME